MLNFWKVLALEIKNYPDTKASGESYWIGKIFAIRRLADGCQTKRKVLLERITHHCLEHVFTVRKVISNFSCIVLSHKAKRNATNVCLFRNCFRAIRQSGHESKQSHSTSLRSFRSKVTRVYLSRETNWRSENSSQTSDFDFENLSSLQSFVSR